MEEQDEIEGTEKKKFKYGIIYLSYVPEGLNVRLLREIFSQFGDIGRIYLAPGKDGKKKKSKHKREYVEGWIEFKKKRIAKQVAKTMNGTELNFARRGCKLNGQVWSLKYLHRFKWTNLTEDIMHAKAIRDQKLRFGIDQAKKQVNFYQKMADRSSKMKNMKARSDDEECGKNTSSSSSRVTNHFYQNQPYQEDQDKMNIETDLLSQIFKRTS